MADEPIQDPGGPGRPERTTTGTAAPAPAAPTDVSALQAERDDLYDRLLRKTAEFDNYRKRTERERREHADQSVVDLLQELLLIVDDFDRALTVESSDAAAYRRGVELIHAKVHDVLRKQGITPIAALGADFDPNVHQAVVQEASPSHREGEVIGELRRGYMKGERLLRPAMVKVAKA